MGGLLTILWEVGSPQLHTAAQVTNMRIQLRTDRPRGKFMMEVGLRVYTLFEVTATHAGAQIVATEAPKPEWVTAEIVNTILTQVKANAKYIS